MLRNDSFRYGTVSQWLHWTTVLLLIALLVMGKAGDMEAEEGGNALFSWHSSLGVLVFVLAAARVVWHFASPRPPLPPSMSRASRLLARTMHVLLYALLFALPLSGWLAASSERVPIPVFGVASLPSLNLGRWQPSSVAKKPMALAEEDEGQEDGFKEFHDLLGNVLLLLAGLHVAAALKHRFIDRDDMLSRMLPPRLKPQDTPGNPPVGGRTAS